MSLAPRTPLLFALSLALLSVSACGGVSDPDLGAPDSSMLVPDLTAPDDLSMPGGPDIGVHDLRSVTSCDDLGACPVDLPVVRPIVYRFWGASASNLWAVGKGSLTMNWDGTVWRRFKNPGTDDLRAIWGSAASDIWAVGDNATILHWDGTKWSKLASVPVSVGYNDIWGVSATDVWAVGDGGTVIHWDGTSWKDLSPPYINGLMTVWGAVSNDVWIGGEAGMLLRWDGTKLNETASGTIETIWNIRGTGINSVWLTTDGLAGCRKWNGVDWTDISSSAGGSTLWVASDSNVWVATAFPIPGSPMSGGAIFHWDGFTWSGSNLFDPLRATAIWSMGTDGWICNEDGRMARYNGSKWSVSW